MEWWRPELLFPVLGAVGAGAVVGLEREFRGQQAGLRTHILVSLASAMLMLMSLEQSIWAHDLSPEVVRIDPVRMAHGILTGVGFLCGGVIFRTGLTVHGLTTAASLWITSALGMLFGVGLYALAVFSTVMVLLVLAALRLVDALIPREAGALAVMRFDADDAPTAPQLRTQLKEMGIRCASLNQKLLERGKTVEFSGSIRGGGWAELDRLAEVLRDDARIVEFELHPRRP